MTPDGWRGEGALLFGGNGFLGSRILCLYPEMISAGRRPAAGKRHFHIDDLRDLSALRNVEFDRVLCCIGTSRHHELMSRPLSEALDYHLHPTVHLLDQLQPKAFVRLSTVLLYEESASPVTEATTIAPDRNRYLMSQHLGEQAARCYEFRGNVATLRLCNLYGPWPTRRTELIHELLAGKSTVMTREPARDFLYVDDAAHAMAALAQANQSGIFNVGTGVATTVGQVCDLVSTHTGRAIESANQPVTGLKSITVDSSKLRNATNWAPRHSLEQGIAQSWKEMHAPRH